VPRSREQHNKESREHYAKNAKRIKENCRKYRARNKDRAIKRQLELSPEFKLWKAAKGRAKKTGKEFNIDISDVIIPEICPVLGIIIIPGIGSRNDNSPSIDRFNNARGYTKDNIRIISFRANRLKSDANTNEIEQLLKYMRGI